MARMGMDVEAVEKTGRDLKTKATNIQTLIGEIEGLVTGLSSVWDGKDAQQFVNEWWPQHKKNLSSVKESIEGLGQSALNNASEQREVSAR